MANKTKHARKPLQAQRSARIALFLVICAIGIALIVMIAISVITPRTDSASQEGVGADGFRAYIEKNGDLGVGSVVTKNEVITALGTKATSIGDAQVGKVFNLNGDRAQTITFPFVRADGKAAELYIDLKLYKNMQSLNDDNIYVATADAGTINGHPAYYKLAQTIGPDREYHMMVVNGLKAYRFVVSQPAGNLTISEISALASLKKLAQDAKL